jgi:hypothetical protein
MNKNSIALIFSVITISLGILPSLAQAKQPVSDTQVAAMVEALRLAAPQTKKRNDGYYSEWQVKPETLKGWTKTCLKKELTPTQFENDPQVARQVISCIMNRELNKQFVTTKNNESSAVRGVACWWMTGNYTGCDKGFTADYVQKVVRFYKQEVTKPAAVTSPPRKSVN